MEKASTGKKTALFSIGLTVLFAAIAAFAFIHYEKTKEFNAADRFTYGLDNSVCAVSVEQKGSWPKEDSLIEGVNRGGQYDITISNFSGYEINDWSLRINIKNECYLNQAWNGTVEIHQNIGRTTEKVQTLDLHNFSFDFDDMLLEYVGRDKNNLMIHLRQGDYIIYKPCRDNVFQEHLLPPFNGTPGGKTIGLIFYYTKKTDFLSYGLTYHFNKGFFQGVEFYVLLALSFVWILLFIVFWVWLAICRRAEHELREREAMLEETLDLISHFVDAKDPYTNGHSERVSNYAFKLAKKLGFKERNAKYVYYAAILHDIGKSYIPDEILKKPDRLTPDEYEQIKNHTVYGHNMLKNITSILGIADGAYYHHERFDGKGYPTGKSGLDIPYIARIICVADSFDAMNSSRCYRGTVTKDEILSEFKNNRGKQFDPDVLDAMLELLDSGEIVFEDLSAMPVSDTDGESENTDGADE